MMDLKMEVYSPFLELLGLLEIQNSVMWENKAFSAGSFTLNSLITEESKTFLVPENIIWIAGDDAGIIEYVQQETGENGPYITVKGCNLTGLLARRILWGRYDLSGPIPEIMYRLVDDCCINPTRGETEARKIPGLVLDGAAPSGGPSIRVQKTGGYLLDALEELGTAYGVPFGVRFNPAVPCMEFWARYGVNRSIHQNNVEPVFYSTELDDVLSSEYSYNAQNYRNVALVAGEGEGNDRVMVIVNGDVEPAPEPPTPPTPTKYTITLSVDPEGGGVALGGGTFSEGQSVIITATPSSGYEFAGWREDGQIVNGDVEYTFTVTRDRNLVSVFSVVSKLPEGYTEVEYILTNTSFGIDTGVKVNANTSRIVMDIEYQSGSADYFIFCTYGENVSGLGWRYFSLMSHTASYFAYRDNSNSYGTITAMKKGERGIIDYNCLSKSLMVGNTQKAINSGNYSFTSNTYFGKAGSADKAAVYKLYSAQLYFDEEKIRDYIPCISPSGVVGLYDLIERKFYGNAWSGSPTAGPAV